ncbi:MAG: hypothetical protein LUC43_09205 [Burkholderiales bacterium]|nr:hypothetical protein [Burkholderiales bacterium]
MKKSIVLASIVAGFFALSPVQATPNVCLAMTVNEAYTCSEGQVLAIPINEAADRRPGYEKVFNILASRIIGALCAPEQAIVFVPNWTINCTVQKKYNAEIILKEVLAAEKEELEKAQKEQKENSKPQTEDKFDLWSFFRRLFSDRN